MFVRAAQINLLRKISSNVANVILRGYRYHSSTEVYLETLVTAKISECGQPQKHLTSVPVGWLGQS